MNVGRHVVYLSDTGRVSLNPRDVALWDTERWAETRFRTVGQKNVVTKLIAALDEYPELVEEVMRQYQSQLDDAARLEHALRSEEQAPGLSD